MLEETWNKCQLFALLWHFLIPNFYKPGLNDLKISEDLLLYEFYVISKNDEIAGFGTCSIPPKRSFFEIFLSFQVKFVTWR